MSTFKNEQSYGSLELLQQVNSYWRCDAQHKLIGPKTLIGRSPKCDLVIRDKSVSRCHAEIFITRDKRVYLRCLSDKGIHVHRREDQEPIVEYKESEPRELRNLDNIMIGTRRVKVSLWDIAEREAFSYSTGSPYQARSQEEANIHATLEDIMSSGMAGDETETDFSQSSQNSQNSQPNLISLTPNIDRARTVSTSPATVPFIQANGQESKSVRVRKTSSIRSDSKHIDEVLAISQAGAQPIIIEKDARDLETENQLELTSPAQTMSQSSTGTDASQSSVASAGTGNSDQPKSILKSNKKPKRRKSVRFSAFSDEASIVNKEDGSGRVTPAKKVFPPHIQKGISATRASPAISLPAPTFQPSANQHQQDMLKQKSAPRSRLQVTPYPTNSTTQMTRRYGIGGPLSSIRRSAKRANTATHFPTPRPVGSFDAPVAPRSPSYFTKEFGVDMRSALSSKRLFEAVSRIKQTPARLNKLTPAKRNTLESVFRGLSHLKVRTPRVPDTPAALQMQISPIKQRLPPASEEEPSDEDATITHLVSDMVSLLDLNVPEEPQQGFSVTSFFSSFLPGVTSSANAPNDSLTEIRELLKELPAQSDEPMNALDALKTVAEHCDEFEEGEIQDTDAYPRPIFVQSQKSFVESNSDGSVNYSNVQLGIGHGASFTCESDRDVVMSDVQDGIPVVKRTYTPETDREVAKQECIQMFDGLANSLGVSSEQIPEIAARKVEFALECLKNKIQADPEDACASDLGPSFDVNGSETARELSQIFETSEQNVSRVVSEHLKQGLTELLQQPEQMVNLSPESRNFAIASLSEVVAGPDSAERLSELLVSAPKTVKSPLSILDGVCQLVKTPHSLAERQMEKRVRINPNANFHDDECELSDLDKPELTTAANELDLSGLMGDLGIGEAVEFEEPTAALQKDLYSQFKEIEKTQKLNLKIPPEDDGLHAHEVDSDLADAADTAELLRMFGAKHSPNLSGLGFSKAFTLHRPMDDDETDDEEDDLNDSLPVDFLQSSETPRSVVSMVHTANASFSTNESRVTDAQLSSASPEPDSNPQDEEPVDYRWKEPVVRKRYQPPMTVQPQQKLGWRRKRRVSEPIPNLSFVNEADRMDVDEEDSETTSRKRGHNQLSPTEESGPPRKRLRRSSELAPSQVPPETFPYRLPLEDVFAATEENLVSQTSEVPSRHATDEDGKEMSHDSNSDTEEISSSDDDEDEVVPDLNTNNTFSSVVAPVFSAAAPTSIPLVSLPTAPEPPRGVKRGRDAPESPRTVKTRLFHQDTDMEELVPLNLARSASSFCVPVMNGSSDGRPSWCTNVTVNGFPYLCVDAEEIFEEVSMDEDAIDALQPVFAEEIVAIDMDEPSLNQINASKSPRSVPLTPLKRICGDRVRPYPQSAFIPRVRHDQVSLSARPSTRRSSRLSDNGSARGPATPKPASKRKRVHPHSEFIARTKKPVEERRRRSERLPGALDTLAEAPQEEFSFMEERKEQDLREDSLPSVRDSADEANEAATEDNDEPATELHAQTTDMSIDDVSEDDDEHPPSVIDMNIELPTDLNAGRPAKEVFEDLRREEEKSFVFDANETAGGEVYSIPIHAEHLTVPHTDVNCTKLSRKRTLGEMDDSDEDAVADVQAPQLKRRRIESLDENTQENMNECEDVEMADQMVDQGGSEKTEEETHMLNDQSSPSESRSRKRSLSSRRTLIRQARSAKSKPKPTPKPVRRSLRIAMRRQSQQNGMGDSQVVNDVNVSTMNPNTMEHEDVEPHTSDNDQKIHCETDEVEKSRDRETIEIVAPTAAEKEQSEFQDADSENEAPQPNDENSARKFEKKVPSKRTSPFRVGGVEIDRLRVMDLRKELRKRKLDSTGKKDVLKKRLIDDMAKDTSRPTMRRKAKPTRARTDVHDRVQRHPHKRVKKTVHRAATSTKPLGRTRVSTQKKARIPLQNLGVNGQSDQSTDSGVLTEDRISHLKVVELRKELKKCGLDPTGKKPTLVARLTEFVRTTTKQPVRRRRQIIR